MDIKTHEGRGTSRKKRLKFIERVKPTKPKTLMTNSALAKADNTLSDNAQSVDADQKRMHDAFNALAAQFIAEGSLCNPADPFKEAAEASPVTTLIVDKFRKQGLMRTHS